MNIAFYLESLNENDKIQLIQEELTRNSDYISNASIFYNNIAPLQINLSAAIFHSSDLWSFEGVLIIDRISNLIKTKKKVMSTFFKYEGIALMSIKEFILSK